MALHAAGVNPMDWKVVAGAFRDVAEHRYPLVPGIDGAGTVVAHGPDLDAHSAARLPIGADVFGVFAKPWFGGGTFAEYATSPASGFATRPAAISATTAAAVPTIGIVALTVVDALDPAPGSTVLVVGASGAIGSLVVQLAVARGAHVLATGRPTHHDRLRGLGAGEVIDHSRQDVTARVRDHHPDGVDGLVRLLGDDVRDLDRRQVDAQATALLPRGGILASTTPPADPDALARGGITTVPVMRRPDHADLHRLAALLTAGRVVPPQVDHRPLDRARQALADIHAGATPAKLVLITT